MEDLVIDRKPLAERKAEALTLRKAGVSPGAIAKRLGFRDGAAVDKVVAELLAKDMPADSALRWQDLELARVDDLQVRLIQKLQAGEKGVERDLMKLMDYRLRLQTSRNRGPGRMVQAVEAACKDLTLTAADESAKQSALDMALMIDVALSVGTADDHRRAINAMATMRNLLNDLGASPSAREELDGIVRSGSAERPLALAGSEPEDDTPEKGAEVLSFMDRARQRHA